MPSDVLQQAGKALMNLDTESLVSAYADDFLYEDTSTGDRITNKEELKEYFDRLFAMPGVSFSEVSFFAMGDRAAGQWTWRGVSRQSGHAFAVRGASLFKLDKDRIKEEIMFYDSSPANS
ncbi:MAG: nuclear transport factor 2 family protein [Anaerolineales bacterium]